MSEFIYDPDDPMPLARYVQENLWNLHPGKGVNALLSFDNDRRLISLDALEVEGVMVMGLEQFRTGWEAIAHLVKLNGATNWMLAHNHTSARPPVPSDKDAEVTASSVVHGKQIGVHFRGMLIANQDASACGILQGNQLDIPMGPSPAEIEHMIADVERNGDKHLLRFDDDEMREEWLRGMIELRNVFAENDQTSEAAMLDKLIAEMTENHTVSPETFAASLRMVRDGSLRGHSTPVDAGLLERGAAQARAAAEFSTSNVFDLPKINFSNDKNQLN